jgi:hypothetical protein
MTSNNLRLFALLTAITAVGSGVLLGHVNIANNVLDCDSQITPAFFSAQSVILEPLNKINQPYKPAASASPDISNDSSSSSDKFRSGLGEVAGLAKNIPLPNAGKSNELTPPVAGSLVSVQPVAKKQSKQEGQKAESIWSIHNLCVYIQFGLIGFLIAYCRPRRRSSYSDIYPMYRREWPNEKS